MIQHHFGQKATQTSCKEVLPETWSSEGKLYKVKMYLRSVSLALLSMTSCTPIDSVLRLCRVQQHLFFGWSGEFGDQLYLETGDGVQLGCLLVNFT